MKTANVKWNKAEINSKMGGLTFLGRNGAFKCTGIDISQIGDRIMIMPYTSRNIVGRAYIEIPVKKLPEVIAHLKTFSKTTKK